MSRAEDTRVAIVDRRDFDRLALEILCGQTSGITVSASVASVSEAVGALKRIPAVALVGRQALLAYGPEATARLRAAGAERVILVGTGDRDQLRVEAMRVDADGFVKRDGDDLSQTRVLRGELDTVPRWLDDAAGDHPRG
jgi:DNA-binding NarL/FixJ family response regulator